VPFDPTKVALKLNGFPLYKDGAPVSFDGRAVSQSIRDSRDTLIELSFGDGDTSLTFWDDRPYGPSTCG